MLPSFLTHYYEAERGPFKNICDLSEEEVDRLISAEKNAPGDSGARVLKALKGPSDPADVELDYLRLSMDNPCFCRVHSSDDAVSAVREAQIFFGAQRLRESLQENTGSHYHPNQNVR